MQQMTGLALLHLHRVPPIRPRSINFPRYPQSSLKWQALGTTSHRRHCIILTIHRLGLAVSSLPSLMHLMYRGEQIGYNYLGANPISPRLPPRTHMDETGSRLRGNLSLLMSICAMLERRNSGLRAP